MRWKAFDSHPSDSRVKELEDGVCSTVVSNWCKRGSTGVLVMKVFERHDQDSRYRDMGGVCETVSAKYGTGGGNQPIVCLMDQGGSVMNFERGKTVEKLHEVGKSKKNGTMSDVVPALTSPGGKPGQGNPVIAYGLHPFIDNTNTATKHAGPDGDGFKKEQAFTLASMGVPKVAKCIAMSECGNDWAITEEKTPPLKVASQAVICRHEVRRLMPIECERLQGMPDNWTRIPYRGKPAEDCPDSPRYKAIGNSWAVPVIHWIGKRIDAAVKAAEPVSNDDDDWI